MGNSQRFRESFKKLFLSAFPEEELTIVVQNGSGNHQTVNFFKNEAHTIPEVLLLIDLDGPKTDRENVLNRLDLSEFEQRVFFIIQAMESWILSQPDKIESCYANFRYRNTPIASDNLLQGKNPEDIPSPDRILEIILGRFFRIKRNGKNQKLKYSKLKDAPDLIELLDFNRLRGTFEDANRLYQKMIELSPSAK